eukprot:492164_1
MMSAHVDLAHIRNIKYYQNGSTIIYCPLQKDCEKIVKKLNKTKITTTVAYHSGLKTSEKEHNQTKWQRDEYQCIVATEAFGMGIDKPNVRYVIHYGSPKSIEAYYQQVGRAGRDGMKSHVLLFYGSDDFGVKNRRVDNMNDEDKKYQAMIQTQDLKKLIFNNKCRVQLILKHFNESISECFNRCDNCTINLGVEVKVDVDTQQHESKDDEIKTMEIDVDDCKDTAKVLPIDSAEINIIGPIKPRHITNDTQEQVIFDSTCSTYSIDTPMPIQR